jgi:sugar (pentulose or hexulose) kinase
MTTALLSLDLGTTHLKAGLFTPDGSLIKIASRDIITRQHPSGSAYFDPQELWASVIEIINEVTQGVDAREIAAVGIASMAETGLLIDKRDGEPRFPLIPWFDAAAIPQVEVLKSTGEPRERFCRSGIRPNSKCGLAKLLWLQQEHPDSLPGTTWLSTADFIAFRLSGAMVTDYSLAGRTYAFRIDQKTWDDDWLQSFGFHAGQFPHPVPSGQPIGGILSESASRIGLLEGTPVAVCGHDHVCAAFTGVGYDTGKIFDSMGTAEALVGSLDKEALGDSEYRSGLVFGCHVAGGGYYWMGGISASGGSLEWLRCLLGDPPLTYQEIEDLLEKASSEPTGILYFPYLSGSSSPHTDSLARGAFIGLTKDHTRSDLVKAVLEGTSYEAEFIRIRAQEILGEEIGLITASGGGTRSSHWMQIKADISGCPIEVPAMREATLLGAALVVGIGIGLYADPQEALSKVAVDPDQIYTPDESHHKIYQQVYQDGYLPLQSPLRQASHLLARG